MEKTGKTLRLFVALPLPAPLKTKIARELLDAPWMKRPGVRPVPAANLHLTLNFIGDAEVGALSALKDALIAALTGIARFKLTLRGGGAFPSMASPRVFYLAVPEDSRSLLSDLASRVKEACAEAGLRGDPKPFKAHLTIARADDRLDSTAGSEIIANLNRYQADSFDARDVIVYSSDLSGGAPVYRTEITVPLNENHDRIRQ